MANLILPHTFVSGTLAQSSQVNAQFAAVEAFIEGECIQRDASLAFTARPSGPAAHPSSANQLVHKLYVDRRIQSGTVVLNFAGTATVVAANVTFPTAFTAPPVVLCGVNGAAPTSFGTRTNDVTASLFDVAVTTVDGSPHTGSLTLFWIAIGTPT